MNATDLNLTLSTAKGNNLTGLAQLQDPTNNQAIFNVTFNSANTSEEYVFVVISTNYTSYSVAWLCKDLTNETSSRECFVLFFATNRTFLLCRNRVGVLEKFNTRKCERFSRSQQNFDVKQFKSHITFAGRGDLL